MRKILIIDDDVALSDITKDMLEQYEYEVHQAFSVDEAFTVLTDKRFDLILLDIIFRMEQALRYASSCVRFPMCR